MSKSPKERYGNRSQEEVKVASPERVQRARKAGPHGTAISADGSKFVEPKKKKRELNQ